MPAALKVGPHRMRVIGRTAAALQRLPLAEVFFDIQRMTPTPRVHEH